MCYEFWHRQRRQQQQDDIAKHVQDMIEKAKTAPPAPKTPQRPVTEKETVPA